MLLLDSMFGKIESRQSKKKNIQTHFQIFSHCDGIYGHTFVGSFGSWRPGVLFWQRRFPEKEQIPN